ncbi:hypothetical protein BO70DRAFT_364853 [Aspergillus heteromorphus CBS 117.55]|uniref:Mso1 N-terminal domain-containing protein n=1 Tax=Aspergillus heteromorphus CBS 117.55 TaxID=1448321 RepID=A0A317VD74_9EURO|nr:uncharacterized protein BO70DRAFT_364853 [Aspergillus heteromorphus CBS 117.55]PWY72324.1 hypothetical protein BO70DRAFT_364853 [Aspergillus heteromorphus CBS 117.55]
MFSSFTSSSAISNLGTRLRRAINLGDEADDPDHEDCSHISSVLRAYYTEKGRPYPGWLPPDPKAPAPAPSRVIATTQIQAGGGGGGAPAAASSYGRGGGLGDLWGDSGSATPPTSQTASLRRGRLAPGGGMGGAPLAATASAPSGPIPSPHSHSPAPPAHPAGGRPLPSQRLGSYQTISGPAGGSGSPGLERAASAQERLRARLHGGRSPSPGQNPGSRPGSPYVADPSARKPVGILPGRR